MDSDHSCDSATMHVPDFFTQERPSSQRSREETEGEEALGVTCQESKETAALHVDIGNVLTQPRFEATNVELGSDAEEKNSDDEPAAASAGDSLSSEGGDTDDDSSCGLLDGRAKMMASMAKELMERRARNIARRNAFRESLGFAKQNDSPELEAQISDEESVISEVANRKSGMLFSTSRNEIASCREDPCGMRYLASTDPTRLQDRYPFRQTQIRLLTSLMGSTMAQAVSDAPVASQDVYVPSPIFVTGPSGTGKTSIVLDALESTKRQYTSALDMDSPAQPVIEHAYVNCSTVDPCSFDAIVRSAFSQLTKVMDDDLSRRQSKKKKKRKRSKQKAKVSSRDSSTKQRKLDSTNSLNRDPSAKKKSRLDERANVESEDAAAMEAIGDRNVDSTRESSVEEAIDEPADADFDGEDEAAMEAMEDRIEQTRAQLGQELSNQDTSESSRRKSLSRKAKSAPQEATSGFIKSRGIQHSVGPEKNRGSGVSNLATVAFGKALLPFFGADAYYLSGGKRPGCAFLVLDHAERLHSLGSQKAMENNNYLSQLLLLPKVYGLNLTVIVITSNTMLDCSRINNDVSVEKALGIVSIAVRPIRVHFAAYAGKDTFKEILKHPSVLPLVVGDSYTAPERGHEQTTTKQLIVSSFLDTLIQSLLGITRDLREMIRIGRQMWTVYIEPLHPDRASKTLRAVRERLVDIAPNDSAPSSHAALQKEVRVFLDENLLPRMKSCINANLFSLASDLKTRKEASKVHELSYLSKCLLLSAFICQHNKPDKDKRLFTIQKNSKKKTKNFHHFSQANSAYGGTTTMEQQQLKMIRPRLFPMERMLSVFVNIVGLNQNDDLLPLCEDGLDMQDYVRSMGSTPFFENLAQLRESGILHETTGSSFTNSSVNVNSTKFWCSLSRDEAEAVAASVGLPLSDYLL